MPRNPQIARNNSYENATYHLITMCWNMCKNTQKQMLVSWARRTSASVTMCDNFLWSSRSRTDKYFKLIVLTTSWLKKSSPSNQQTTNWEHTHACTHAVLKCDGCIAHWRNTYSIILNSQLSLVSVTTTWLYHDNGRQLQETSVVRSYWNAIMPVTGPRFLRKEIFTIIIIDDSLEPL